MKQEEPEFLRPVKGFALLDLSKSRGYEAIQKGEIPHIRIGGLIRIPRRWIDEQIKKAIEESAAR